MSSSALLPCPQRCKERRRGTPSPRRRARTQCRHRVETCLATASAMSRARREALQVRCEPASSPSPVARPRDFSHRLQRVVGLRTPAQRLLERRGTMGATMNSCTSTFESAWAPPLRMFIIGTGSTCAAGPPTYRKSGSSALSAAALATARLTPSTALAPRRDLSGVPSRSSRAWSTSRCSLASYPSSSGPMSSRTARTAFSTPLPRPFASHVAQLAASLPR